MKKKYKILIIVISVEFFILGIMNKLGMKAVTWLENFVGIILCFLPIQILLFMLSRDKDISSSKRIIPTIAFWFINICILLGAVATALEELGILP